MKLVRQQSDSPLRARGLSCSESAKRRPSERPVKAPSVTDLRHVQQAHATGGQRLDRSGVMALQRMVGNRVVTQLLSAARVHQDEGSSKALRQAAQIGIQTPTCELPYAAQVQQSFGRHDVSGIRAHLGTQATTAALGINAAAYATGSHVVFAGTPSLHTVAHEAAHVVQQRGGVQLANGIGAEGDRYEQHADAVAQRVVTGQSAEELLTPYAGENGEARGPVQQQPQDRPAPSGNLIQRTLLIRGQQLTSNTIRAHIAEIQEQSTPALRDSGIDTTTLNWEDIANQLAELADHGQPFNYERTSYAILQILEAGGAAAIIANGAASQKGQKAQPAKAQTTFAYTHDPHGAKKHFTGKLKQGSQWSISFADADKLMLGDVKANLEVLLANAPEGQTSLFYLTKDHGKKIGTVDYPSNKTSVYTVQIDVDRKKSVITYHEYPVDEQSPPGLGKTLKKKDLQYK